MALFMRHLRAIFYFKQGIFYKFYPQENIIRQPTELHPPTQPRGILKIKMQLVGPPKFPLKSTSHIIINKQNFCYFLAKQLSLFFIFLFGQSDKDIFRALSLIKFYLKIFSLSSCSAPPPGIEVCCGEINLSRFLLYSDLI